MKPVLKRCNRQRYFNLYIYICKGECDATFWVEFIGGPFGDLPAQMWWWMPIVIAWVAGNAFCQLLDSTHSENNPMCCCTLLDANHSRMVVEVYIASIQTRRQSLFCGTKEKMVQWICRKITRIHVNVTYDKQIDVQPVECPIRVSMFGNTFLCHRDNRCAASNRDRCCTFSVPKIVRPTVLLDISVGWGQV